MIARLSLTSTYNALCAPQPRRSSIILEPSTIIIFGAEWLLQIGESWYSGTVVLTVPIRFRFISTQPLVYFCRQVNHRICIVLTIFCTSFSSWLVNSFLRNRCFLPRSAHLAIANSPIDQTLMTNIHLKAFTKSYRMVALAYEYSSAKRFTFQILGAAAYQATLLHWSSIWSPKCKTPTVLRHSYW